MKRLFIATDQGKRSGSIIMAGLSLARKLHLPVDIFTVVDEATVFTEPNTGIVLTEAFDDRYQQSKRYLEELKSSNPDIDLKVHCIVGNPKQILVEEAREKDSCMLVIGTHGRTGLDHLVLGSTAEYIIRHATVPVLVLPYTKMTE